MTLDELIVLLIRAKQAREAINVLEHARENMLFKEDLGPEKNKWRDHISSCITEAILKIEGPFMVDPNKF